MSHEAAVAAAEEEARYEGFYPGPENMENPAPLYQFYRCSGGVTFNTPIVEQERCFRRGHAWATYFRLRQEEQYDEMETRTLDRMELLASCRT